MLEGFIFHVKNFEQELKILGLDNLENVSSDKLLNECFSELRGDLESVDSEAEKNFNDALNVFVFEVLLKFLFMILDDRFADKFGSFDSAFVDNYFVVFTELNFVVFDGII
jgi:hypothetical protein